MKKVLILVLFLVVVGGYALSASRKTDSTGALKIGSILILTGEGASWGEASKNGIDMAVADINADGGVNGKKLVVIHEDNASEPSKAISAFKKLTEADGIRFIIGPNWSNSGLPLIDLAKQKQAVLISPSLGVREFNEANEFLFNTWPHDSLLSSQLADYVYKKGARSVALFGAQDVWVKDQTKAFKERFERLGGKVAFLYEPNTTETDVRTEIAKMKDNKSVDTVVMTIDGYALTTIVARQLKESGVKLPMYSITLDRKIISDCVGACDGMEFLTFLTPTKNFETRYKAKYNREAEIGSDSAYDAVMLLAKVMKETRSENSVVIAQALAKIQKYSGASGALVSDGKRAFAKPYLVKQIVKGEPITVAE